MQGLQRLLAATDLSAPARHAAERASAIARVTGATLDLLHVAAFSQANELRRLVATLPADLPERMREQSRMMLDALAATLRERDGVSPRTHLATGALPQALEEAAQATDAQLLVLGARGASTMRHFLLGSTAERIVSTVSRPILVVKRAPAADYRRVLVPVDFSENSVDALRLAHAVAPDATLVVMHAYEAPFEGKLLVAGVEEEHLREYRAAARTEAQQRMDALCQESGLPPARMRQELVHGGPVRSILQQEDEQDADLIVLARQGQSRVDDVLLGSVSRRVLVEAEADVLVLP